MSSKSTDHKLSRNDIVAAVAHLIAEQGLESLTMRNIARHIGCSVGTLPHYFEGKDDIVIAALNWSNERILGRLSNLPASEIHLETLYPLLTAAMPTDRQSDMEWRVRLCLWDYAVTNEEMRESVNAIEDAAIHTLNSLVGYLQEAGEISNATDANTIALTMYHMCIGASFNMLHKSMEGRDLQLQPLFSYLEGIRQQPPLSGHNQG